MNGVPRCTVPGAVSTLLLCLPGELPQRLGGERATGVAVGRPCPHGLSPPSLSSALRLLPQDFGAACASVTQSASDYWEPSTVAPFQDQGIQVCFH